MALKNRTTLFISDLHLQESEPEIARQFLAFLALYARKSDALYILGDLFEAWIGDDDLTPFHLSIIKALREATLQGLPVFVAKGNRDFLLGSEFCRATGCRLLGDETVVDLYGTRVLLMHGDTLCTRDVKYIRFRKKMHNRVVQKLFLSLPLFVRRKLAAKARAGSRNYTQKLTLEMMDVCEKEVVKVLHKYRLDLVIHGHTHRPGIHPNRIVLGAWHTQVNMLQWNSNGERELINCSLD